MNWIPFALVSVGAAFLHGGGVQAPHATGMKQPRARYAIITFSVAWLVLLIMSGVMLGAWWGLLLGVFPGMLLRFALQILLPSLRGAGIQVLAGALLMAAGVLLRLSH